VAGQLHSIGLITTMGDPGLVYARIDLDSPHLPAQVPLAFPVRDGRLAIGGDGLPQVAYWQHVGTDWQLTWQRPGGAAEIVTRFSGDRDWWPGRPSLAVAAEALGRHQPHLLFRLQEGTVEGADAAPAQLVHAHRRSDGSWSLQTVAREDDGLALTPIGVATDDCGQVRLVYRRLTPSKATLHVAAVVDGGMVDALVPTDGSAPGQDAALRVGGDGVMHLLDSSGPLTTYLAIGR
jgi:hypothetical protein